MCLSEWGECHVDGTEVGCAHLDEALSLEGKSCSSSSMFFFLVLRRKYVEGGDKVSAVSGVDDSDGVSESESGLREAGAWVEIERRCVLKWLCLTSWFICACEDGGDVVVDHERRERCLLVVVVFDGFWKEEVEAGVWERVVLLLSVMLVDVGLISFMERGFLRVDVEG